MMRSLQTMAWPVLIGCVSLWIGPALAEVVPFSETPLCSSFFYKAIPPSGFNTSDTPLICQRYSEEFYYATLYDKISRIPRWSAYTLNDSDCSKEFHRMFRWFVEPQLAGLSKNQDMMPEDGSEGTLEEQAINEDYEDTAYERGHLNPYFFHCKNHRTATFTLTNAVPMEPHFHQIRWSKLEKSLKSRLKGSCIRDGGSPYLVTGAVSRDNVTIPIQGEDMEWQRNRKYNRVSVPSHIWTAVCCDHADDTQKFSLSILAENKEESRLQIIPVEELSRELAHLYNISEPLGLFADGCGSKSPKAQSISTAIKLDVYDSFQIFLADFYSQLLPVEEKSRLDAETTQVLRSKNLEEASLQLTGIEFTVTFPSLADWHRGFEKLYKQDNLSCVLAPAAAGTTDRVCTLQEQKQLLGSTVTATGMTCVGAPCGFHGSNYSWCYTSYSGDRDSCCTDKCLVNPVSGRYECSRGDSTTVACSPQYSAVTVSGKPCRADHPCGLYGEDSFWCYTDYKQNREDCCSPQGYCRKNGRNYNWCHTKDPQNCWERCTP